LEGILTGVSLGFIESNITVYGPKWSIIIKAEDNLSGVYKYNGYIDGQWVLMEFDYKKKRLIHYFEDDLQKGEHTFKLIVKDKIGNESFYDSTFSR